MWVLILVGASKAEHSTDPQDGPSLCTDGEYLASSVLRSKAGGNSKTTHTAVSLGFSATFKLV